MSDYIRYAKNIRRLAEQLKNTNSSLEAAQIRAKIAAERRIGYITGNGNTAVSNPGVPGETSPYANFGNLLGFATDKQLKDVLNTINNNYKSINSVLNMGIGGKANGINGLKDCATGKKVEVNNTPIFKNPDGWLGPNDPGTAIPEYEKWTLGVRWVGPGVIGHFLTALEAAKASRDAAGASAWSIIEGSNHITSGADIWQIFFRNPSLPPGSFPAVYQGSAVACTPSDDDAMCPLSYQYLWPVDNVMQLSRDANGKYKYSTNEPAADIIPSLTDNKHSTLNLCFDDGSGRKASIEPTYNGGYMIFERNPVTGERIGRGQLFDKNNVLVTHIMPDEATSWLALGAS